MATIQDLKNSLQVAIAERDEQIMEMIQDLGVRLNKFDEVDSRHKFYICETLPVLFEHQDEDRAELAQIERGEHRFQIA